MTPEEHYAEAERLAEAVVSGEDDRTPANDDGDDSPWTDRTIALAQVHATLAASPRTTAVDVAREQRRQVRR